MYTRHICKRATQESSFQKEMSFKHFSSLSYQDKLARCNNAYKLLQGRQQRVNRHMVVLRTQATMQESFLSMLLLDGQLCQTIFNLFDSSINLQHNYQDTKCNPFKLKEVTEDICKLLGFIEHVPKTDSDMDVLFVSAHTVKETQINLHKQYYIKHNFNSEAQPPPLVKDDVVPPEERIVFDFDFLTGKELKQKYLELNKHFFVKKE